MVVLVAFPCGCTADRSDPPTIQTWRQSLEKYVWEHANGDPNVVADMSWDDVHKGFAVIGEPLADRSTDQIGLLVAHKLLNGKPFFLFVLGTVRQQKLEGICAVALQVEGEAFYWTVGPDDPKSLGLYRAWSDADRTQAGPREPVPPPFPRVEESFEVTIENDQFVIRHRESGARWEVRPLTLSATRATRRAGPLRE
ncbi:MAG TPA: hypothetical protein VG269_27710 [Tepidisphaeraceae bacterium]|jgi:hypothetical protein|nr:hypothetical protein [Tepidisphaeraceae bacterium]